MAKDKDTENVKRTKDERRESSERREGEFVTMKKLFNDYGFEDEREKDVRRDGPSRRGK